MREEKPEKNRDFLFLLIALLVIVFLALAFSKAVLVIGQKTLDNTDSVNIMESLGNDDNKSAGFRGKKYLTEDIGLSSDEADAAIEILESCGIHAINYVNKVPSVEGEKLSYFFDSSDPEVTGLMMVFNDNNEVVEVNNVVEPLYYYGDILHDISEYYFSEEDRKACLDIVFSEALKQENVATVKLDDTQYPPIFTMISPDEKYYSAIGVLLVTYDDGTEESVMFGIEIKGEEVYSFTMTK